MVLRRAIKRHDGITAECPVEGECQYRQLTQGKMMDLACGFFRGTIENERGLMVKCDNLLPCTN